MTLPLTLVALGTVLGLFGLVGAWRGWLREAAALGGVLLAWLIVGLTGEGLIALLNRVYLIGQFISQGGFDRPDPGDLLRTLRARPLLTPAQAGWVTAGLFTALTALIYLVTHRLRARATGLAGPLLGFGLGLLNGYLVSYVTLGQVAGLIGPGSGPLLQAHQVLEQYLTGTVLLGVGLVLMTALLSTWRLSARGRRRSVSG